ncbi:MAG: hypothetical protein Ct9H300mP1_27300 [Planctomycetaceae bacterium]|nr:MAG: hypothetical protein Ct9H300mP1_27300 [Planctomycetaceae bacterium]
MGSKGEQFAGLTVALVTPFADGKNDEAALRASSIFTRIRHRLRQPGGEKPGKVPRCRTTNTNR